jgi:hypothetical protein
MPDGDIYSKNVPRPWVKAARFMFEGGDHVMFVDECEKAIASQSRERSWDGLDEAVRMIAEAQGANRGLPSRRQVLNDLKRFAPIWPPDRYEALRRVANRELAGSSMPQLLMLPGSSRHDHRRQIAVAVLAEWAIMGSAPASQAHRFAQTKAQQATEFVADVTTMRSLLSEAPGMLNLADQVLTSSNVGGRPIRAPRTRITRPSQIDLLNMPIG